VNADLELMVSMRMREKADRETTTDHEAITLEALVIETRGQALIKEVSGNPPLLPSQGGC